MFAEIDALLHSRSRYSITAVRVPWQQLILITICCSFIYGFAMGFFNARLLQCLYAGLKVPLLLAVSTVVCLPNFYAVNMVLGLSSDFAAAFRGILAAQATMALTLASLAPITLLIYASSNSYHFVLLFNGLMFAIATICGQICLLRHYRPLIARNSLHRIVLAVWLLLYVFVAIQTAWVLRPYVGVASQPTTFFREVAWSNAYVMLIRDLAGHFVR